MQGDRWRVSVLADGLVRLEWSEAGAFEDRASTFALHRDLPVPEFEVIDGEGTLEIVTDRLRLTYDRGPFTPAGLSVQARGNISNHHSVWRYGEPVSTLGGTTRTLDDVDGRIELDPGIVSAGGVTALDDSRSFLFEDDGWVSPRPDGGIDVYVFAYGHDYQARARRVLRRLRPAARAAALGARQLVEPLPPLQRRQLPRAARPLRGGAPAVLRRGARHGLAPRRVGAGALRLGLDRLQLGAGAVPRPRGLPRRAAPPRPAGHAQRPPRRRRARLRGRLRAHGRGARPRRLHRRADRVRHHRPRVPRRLPRGPPPPARGRRASTSGGSTGSRAPTRASRASTRCGCSTTSTTSTPAATATAR